MKNTASVEQYIANKPLVVEYVVFCAFCMLDLCSYSCLCPRALANGNQRIQIWEKMLEFFPQQCYMLATVSVSQGRIT